jgi:hypothetical protein
MSSSLERSFIISGRNTIIHKQKKLDLVILNGENDPNVIVTHNGIGVFKESVPRNRREAKERYMEVIYGSSPEIFGERKTLLFVQALDGREYKIDYSKVDTNSFITVHQDSYL